MEASSVIVLIIISVIGMLLKSKREKTPQDGEGSRSAPPKPSQGAIPYAQSGAKVQSAAIKGLDGIKAFLKELEDEGRVVVETQPKSIKLRPQPAKKPAAPAAPVAEEGAASAEGEDTLHGSHRNPEQPGEEAPAARRAAAIFASGTDVRRAVVMSEILGKPVSLRRRGVR